MRKIIWNLTLIAIGIMLRTMGSIAQVKHNKASLQLYYDFEGLAKDKSGKKHKGKINLKIRDFG